MTTLSDASILTEMKKGRLIKNGDQQQVSGACYELRLGNVYYDLTESDHPIQIQAGEPVLIKPGHRVVLITHEELLVPNNILVRVVSKGSLFSVGLSPVATYADPGFTGNLGIVTHNIVISILFSRRSSRLQKPISPNLPAKPRIRIRASMVSVLRYGPSNISCKRRTLKSRPTIASAAKKKRLTGFCP
jgi:hypothetical protein